MKTQSPKNQDIGSSIAVRVPRRAFIRSVGSACLLSAMIWRSIETEAAASDADSESKTLLSTTFELKNGEKWTTGGKPPKGSDPQNEYTDKPTEPFNPPVTEWNGGTYTQDPKDPNKVTITGPATVTIVYAKIRQ